VVKCGWKIMGYKYKIGLPYTDIKSLIQDLIDGKYVYYCNRPKHPSIIKNMTLQTILSFINSKMISKAEINRPDQNEIRLKAIRKNIR
jgi:CRISPR/Cas system CMR-associated protein Cmr5 small subunit